MAKPKTNSFSIYLLKSTFDATNALKDDTKLDAKVDAANLPDGAVLHILDNAPYTPWWVDHFGIKKNLMQALKGAIIFLPADERWLAMCFGHVAHNLKDGSYEYDFGLRVTLNCVDPKKLRSTDILEPSGAKRQRTQLPTAGDLTFFDVDSDSTILKSLTGKVKDEHQKLFKNATGSSNIRVSSAATVADMTELCKELYTLYQKDDYKTEFPHIQNISPIRDPKTVELLNQQLVDALKGKDDALALSVPEIVDFSYEHCGSFTGVGKGKVYDDIFIGRYYEYLEGAKFDISNIAIDQLKRHQLLLTNDDGSSVRAQHSIFRCLVFDTVLKNGTESYHLCEGNWYLVDGDYVTELKTYLDPLCQDTTLPEFNHESEADYNVAAAAAKAGRVCLDMKNISPAGQRQVEPCDIYEVIGDRAVLHCIKISTLSAPLSHLFNQGINSVRLMRSESAAVAKMQELVEEGRDAAEKQALVEPLSKSSFSVVFGIVTDKNKNAKSDNLPLFSRISLMRCMKELKRMGVPAAYCFIKDSSAKSDGQQRKQKKRKQKKSEAPEADEA